MAEMLATPTHNSSPTTHPLLHSRDPHDTYGTLLEDWERHLEWVQGNGLNIRYIAHPCETLCRAAVQQTGLALEFIHAPSPDVCRIAVEQNPKAIRFVPKN